MSLRTFSITLLSALILLGCKESVPNKNLDTQTEDSVTHSTKDQRPFQKRIDSTA